MVRILNGQQTSQKLDTIPDYESVKELSLLGEYQQYHEQHDGQTIITYLQYNGELYMYIVHTNYRLWFSHNMSYLASLLQIEL